MPCGVQWLMGVGCALKLVVSCEQWGQWEVLVQCRGHMGSKVGMARSNWFGHQSGMEWTVACMCQGRASVVICALGEGSRMVGRIVIRGSGGGSQGRALGRVVSEGGLRNGVASAAAGPGSGDLEGVELLGGRPSQGQGKQAYGLAS